MRIGELFRRDITRRIEEVVKVDDPQSIAAELDEYVATSHIVEEMEKVLDAYQESIHNPNEGVTVWTSGFFGSGKSSWAKTLGYLVENPDLDGMSAMERFFGRTDAPRLQALLTTIHAQAPTTTVLLNLATGANVVAKEGDSILKAVYRSLLDRLRYSSNPMLAELEITLEDDGLLEQFQQVFADTHGKTWEQRRYTALARNEASHALHVLRPGTYPQPDSWAKATPNPELTADWLAERALMLLERRGGGVQRLLFVVDEAGQYVARSVQRMLDLQGLAEAFQKRRGRLWLLVTSQERLNDVVDSLESKQVELARAQARFALRVDLLPSDIQEVTSKRVLQKTDAGQSSVRTALHEHWNQLRATTRLESPTRSATPGEDEAVQLYPMQHYQIQLLIDAVSARRTQGGASPTIGGSNRTLIKHAQQLVINPAHGLADAEVGALVTVDRSYDLLTELIPTSWRAEVDQVAATYGHDSVHTRVLKVIALCADVPALPLTVHNLAAMLHPHVSAESQRAAVEAAVADLVNDDRIRDTDDGYRLQSPEQKDWEQTRRGIDLSPGAATRLRRQLLRDALGGLTVTRSRTFKVRIDVDEENVSAGDLHLSIDEAAAERINAIRAASREADQSHRITWTFQISAATFDALLELHRSQEMISRRDTPTKSSTEVELLGEERARLQRHERVAVTALTQDLLTGQVVFRGNAEDVEGGGDLRAVAQRIVTNRLDDIYPRLAEFNAAVGRDTCLTVLRTSDLGTLPEVLGPDGIGLLKATPSGPQFRTDAGPLEAVVAEARTRVNYGTEATGAHLEKHFAAPPFGAPVEVLQTLCAAAVRCGLLEVVHQGQALRDPSDARLDPVLTTLPKFRAAAFRPRRDDDVTLVDRTSLASWLDEQGWDYPGIGTDILAATVRNHLLPHRATAQQVGATLTGLGLPVPTSVTRLTGTLDELDGTDDAGVVRTTLATRADLAHDLPRVDAFAAVLDTRVDTLRAATTELQRWAGRSDESLADERRELTGLLAGDDLLDHVARITSLTSTLRAARQQAARDAAGALSQTITDLANTIRDSYPDLEATAVAEALRPLTQLAPPEPPDDLDAGSLRARIDSAHVRAATARTQLDQLRAQGMLVPVAVATVVPDVIQDEDGLQAALSAIREAVEALLADGKQVRLQ